MGVNAAGQHIQAGGVHHLHILTHFEVLTDGVHDAVFQQHIGHVVVGGSDDAPVVNQGSGGVVRHVGLPEVWVCLKRRANKPPSAGPSIGIQTCVGLQLGNIETSATVGIEGI